jgi:predicted GIY-YIG superfamily endonuclease
MAFVYILRCSDGTYYVGHTNDLAKRESLHNAGVGAAYTAARRPVEMVYSERLPSTLDAIRREHQVKRWSAAKKQALSSGNSAKLRSLSRCRAS